MTPGPAVLQGRIPGAGKRSAWALGAWRGLLLALVLVLGSGHLLADALSELPEPWEGRLLPVVEGDISGAEPLMQQALTQARESVAELLGRGPGAVGNEALAAAYGRLGVLLLLLEVEHPADAALRNAERLEPEEFRWPYYLGYLAMLAGRSESALEHLRRARAIDPSYRPLEVHLGRVLLDRSELDEARALLEPAAEVEGLTAASSYYLGQIAVIERRHQDATRLLNRVLEVDPQALAAHYPLAQAYRALGDDDRAREEMARFQLALPRPADPLVEEMKAVVQRSVPAFERGLEAVRNGDYADAARRFADGLEVAPDNAAARTSLARTLYLSQRPAEAERELERAVEQDPAQPLGHLLLGILALSRGDEEAAGTLLRRARDADPSQAGPLYYLAGIDFNAERWSQAAEGYGRAVAIEASLAPAKLLGIVAAFRAASPGEARSKRALEELGRLREGSHDDLQASYALACLLAATPETALRDPVRALQLAEDALSAMPSPPMQRAKALALAAGGDFAEATGSSRQMLSTALWGAPQSVIDLVRQDLEALEREALPDPWPIGDPMLSPPPLDMLAVFRDYPAVNPY